MALDHKIDEEAFLALSEPVREHYALEGGKYYLQATGLVSKARVDEFRENNIALKTENEKFTSDMAALQKQLEAASKGGNVDEQVEAKVKKRIVELTAENEQKINDLTEGKSKAEALSQKLLVGDAVSREAISAGVQSTALEDVLTRANKVFKVTEGVATPYDGDDVMYGKDGTTPLTVKDWLAGQAVSAPHLFKKHEGSGAANEQKGDGVTKQTLTSTQRIASGLKSL